MFVRQVALPCLIAFLACAAPAAAAVERRDLDPGGAVPGEVLVRFEKGVDASERAAARRAARVDFEEALPLARAQLLEVDGSVRDAVRRLERRPEVDYAQPNYRYRALAPPPDDPLFAQLWGLQNGAHAGVDIAALAAWDSTRGAGQVIAVVDSGVDFSHPDLAPNLLPNGHDFVDDDADPSDYEFHGTHVAGTAAAVAGNGSGIAGAAPEAKILPVRVLDGEGSGSSADIASGIVYAAQQGADVINLSLGGPGNDFLMSNAISQADALDAVVVAAAGNGGGDGSGDDNDVTPTSPCTLPQPNIVCVAAVNESGDLAGFSNFGASTVDLGGPGVGIVSAKTAFETLFADDFDPDLADWDTSLGPAWGTTPGVSGNAAADSPGSNYAADANQFISMLGPVGLSSRVGCRMDFDARLDIADEGAQHGFLIGLDNGADLTGAYFTGADTDGAFEPIELSLREFDDLPGSWAPFMWLLANGDVNVGAGADVDNFSFACRRSYPPADPGEYHTFQGTSMAAPHVAAAAALVRAADPGAPDTQVVAALRQGVTPLGSLAGKTVTGGMVDADAAIDQALAMPNPAPPSGAAATPPPPAPPSPRPRARRPGPAGFRSTVTVDRRGRATLAITAQRNLRGSLRIAARKVTLVRKSFRTGRRGRVRLRLRLTRRAMRLLRRSGGRLRANGTVVLRNAAGLRSVTSIRGMTVRMRR